MLAADANEEIEHGKIIMYEKKKKEETKQQYYRVKSADETFCIAVSMKNYA